MAAAAIRKQPKEEEERRDDNKAEGVFKEPCNDDGTHLSGGKIKHDSRAYGGDLRGA